MHVEIEVNYQGEVELTAASEPMRPRAPNFAASKHRWVRPNAGCLGWLLALALLSQQTVFGLERHWTGADSANWSDPDNWNPAGVPGPDDHLIFGGINVGDHHQSSVNDITGLTVARLVFLNNNYQVDGNTITLGGGLGCYDEDSKHPDSFTVTMNCGLVFLNSTTVETVPFAGDLTETTINLHLNGQIETDQNVDFDTWVDLAFDQSVGTGNSHIYLAGQITGPGNISVFAMSDNYDSTYIEFDGTSPNTFAGTLALSAEDNCQIIFNKTGVAVATNVVWIQGTATINMAGPPNQLGSHTVLLFEDQSQLSLVGNNLTVGSLVFSNKSDSAGLDTGSVLLGLNDGIIAAGMGPTPIITGKINLNGFEPVIISGPSVPGLEIQAAIQGNGFQKLGNNVLVLSGNNTFFGDCEISAGTVQPTTPTAFGQAGPTFGVELDGGSLMMQGLSIANEPLFINSSNSVFKAFSQCTWTGPVTLNQTMRLLAIDPTSSGLMTEFTGPISGPGGISTLPPTLFPQGMVEFAGGAANTFTGPLTLNNPLTVFKKPNGFSAFAGPLEVGSGAGPLCQALWSNNNQSVTAPVTLHVNGLINLHNHSENFGTVTFSGGEIDAGPLGTCSIYGTVTANAWGVEATIQGGNLNLPAGNPAVFNVGDGSAPGGDLVVSAVVIGSAPYLVKQGGGVMAMQVLFNPNTFTGTTLLEGGTIDINNSGSLSTGPIVIFGANAATLRCSGSGTLNQGLELYGDGVGGTQGAIEVNPGVNFSINGGQLLDTETTYNVGIGGTLQLGGALSGSGPLMKTGSGLLVLYGGDNNTYTGDTLIKEGAATLVKNSGAIAVPYNLVIGTKTPASGIGTTATVTNIGFFELNGTNVTVNGGSLYNINGYNEHLLSLTLNSGGSLQTGGGSLGFNGAFDGAAINVNPGAGGASVISGNLYFYSGGKGTFSVGGRSQFALGAPPELDLQAVISDPFSDLLTKNGSGEMRLTAANTINPVMNVDDGKLTLKNSSALGNNVSTVNVNGNAVLAMDGGVNIANRTLYLNSSNSVGALRTVSGFNTWGSPVTLAQTAVIDVEPAIGSLDFRDGLSGPGGFTAIGTGTVKFDGTVNANTYAGLTTISSGVVEAVRTNVSITFNPATGRFRTNLVGVVCIPGDAVIGDDSSPANNAILRSDVRPHFSGSGNFALHASGLIDLPSSAGVNGASETVQSLTGSGNINVGLNSFFNINNPNPCVFSGTVSGSGFFTKTGTGTLVTYGNINSGQNVQLNGGDWKLFGGRFGGNMDVSNGRLRGDGTVDGVVTLSGGQVAVDSHLPDRQGSTLHLGSLASVFGAAIQLDMFGPAPTGGNDQIATTSGGVSLASDTTLATSFSYPPHAGDVIDLISVANGQTITGNFANYADGVMTLVGLTPVIPSYHGGGSGHDFTLTVTNLALGYAGYSLAEGNGNQTVEPNECNLIYVNLANRRNVPVTITNALLRALNANGVLVTVPAATFPTIAAGQTVSNSVPFQFRTDSNLACGAAVTFELVLGVVNEGQFAINFSPVSGGDCSHPTGPCDSCNVVFGQFTTNTPVTAQPLYFVGAPSICYPPKAYPGTNPAPLLAATPYITQGFTNSTTNLLCVTAQLDFDCPSALTNALGVAAYLGQFDANNPANGYLGDLGQGGPPYPAFSFQVPPSTNFTLVVMEQATNLPCNVYTLELFGLPCSPPVLAINPETAPAKVRVNWSTAYPGWTAQQEGKLGGTFSNLVQIPVILNSRYALTNLPAITNQFYRLKK